MTNPNDMLVFLAVAEAGSFTAAADNLVTPKSNVSRIISRLEQKLNVRLLERTTRSLNLTEAGRIYLEHCRRVKEEIEGASVSLETLTQKPSGLLRIGTTVTIGQNIMAQHLIAFQKQYSDVKLDVQLTNRRIDLIEEGIDVVFRVGPSPDSNLISKRLCTLSLNLYASPVYLAAHSTINLPEDLTAHHCLYMNGQQGNPSWPLRMEEKHNTGSAREISITPTLQCNDFNLLYQACIAEQGIALLPNYMCQQAVKQGLLMPVLPQLVGRNIDIHALFPSRKGKLPKLEVLLRFMKTQLNG